jgi:hypothetical protein
VSLRCPIANSVAKVAAALGWSPESLDASAECKDEREVDGGSTDKRDQERRWNVDEGAKVVGCTANMRAREPEWPTRTHNRMPAGYLWRPEEWRS